MPKIAELHGVREYAEGLPVELWRDNDTGRLTIVATNGGGYDSTAIDLRDLLSWLRDGPLDNNCDKEEGLACGP